MTANIKITTDYDMPSIVKAAGGDTNDQSSCWYEGGNLYVKGVTQAALDAALLAYNPASAESSRCRALIKETDKNLIRATEDLIDVLIAKKIIALTELPLILQNKLNERKALRMGIK